jgi:hypothetical protein
MRFVRSVGEIDAVKKKRLLSFSYNIRKPRTKHVLLEFVGNKSLVTFLGGIYWNAVTWKTEKQMGRYPEGCERNKIREYEVN